MKILKQRRFRLAGYRYVVSRVADEKSGVDHLTARYKELRAELNECNLDLGQRKQLRDESKALWDRVQSFKKGEWRYVGVLVEIYRPTRTGQAPLVGMAWEPAIESDAGEAFFFALEKQVIHRAEDDLQALREALGVRVQAYSDLEVLEKELKYA